MPPTTAPANKTALDAARDVIYGDRERTYGSPGKNLDVIADYWETYLRSRGLWGADTGTMTYHDVCNMMVLLKVARLGNSPGHQDSIVDGIGYFALADRVMNHA